MNKGVTRLRTAEDLDKEEVERLGVVADNDVPWTAYGAVWNVMPLLSTLTPSVSVPAAMLPTCPTARCICSVLLPLAGRRSQITQLAEFSPADRERVV
jgi:hypothetical protein